MGIVVVAFLAAWAARVPAVTMTLTFSRQLSRKVRESFVFSIRPSGLKGYVVALQIAEFTQLFPQGFPEMRSTGNGTCL
jgi:hypothetical protein